MNYILRTGHSTELFTKDRIYKISSEAEKGCYITNDKGGISEARTGVKGYWRHASDEEAMDKKIEDHENCKAYRNELVKCGMLSKAIVEIPNAENKHIQSIRDSKMIKINKVSYIEVNGIKTDMISSDDIIAAIEKEQSKIISLEKLLIKSNAIDKLAMKHQANIDDLVNILEEKVESGK